PDRPDDPVALRRVVLLDADGNSTSLLPRGRPFAVEVTFVVHQPLPTLDLTVFVANLRGVRVLDEAWSDVQPSRPGLPGRYIARIEVPPLLTAGDYTAGIWLGSSYETVAYNEEVLAFRLEGGTSGRAERVLQLTAPWRVQRIDDVHAGCNAES
ncbi:MAG: Wzt carbohydrate-binding domain-containing protein, partial [Actinomycetota bacterium]|nr:Wzt carbohydrate-binding domain-containing protein [Actinomycetota bacterium]